MVHHYIKSAIRNLLKSKLASLISIAGLAVALAGVFLVYAYVRWEMSYNHHFSGMENVYRVLRSTDSNAGRAYEVRTSGPLAPALVESYPEVEAAVRLMRRRTYAGNGETGEITRFCVADENVFAFFNLDPSGETLLAEPGKVLISNALAARLYRGADPVGQLIQLEDQFRGDYEVAGTFPDFPVNTTVRFDVLTIRASVGQNHFAWQEWIERGWMQIETFIRLRADADVASFTFRIQDLLDQHLPDVATHSEYHLQPFSRIYLHTLNDFGVAGLPAHETIRYGDAERLKASVGVAVILLLVACANYVNLSTARASLRHREVGVRKAVGASRALLIRHFLSESLMVTLVSVCAGLGVAYLALPAFRELVGSPVSLGTLSLLDGVALLLGSIFVGVAAGAYPAFGLSSLQPVRAIRQQADVTGGGYLRRALVTLQFAASIVLIAFTFVVASQVSHMREQDPGFSSDQVISMMLFQTSNQTRYWGPYGRVLKKQYNSVRERFMSHRNVTGATSTRFGVTAFFPTTVRALGRGGTDELPMAFLGVEESFVGFFGIRLLAGHDFSPATMAERDEGNAQFVLTASAVRLMGYESPEDAIGELMLWSPRLKGTIVGVSEDLMFGSFKSGRQPLMLVPDFANLKTLYVRVKPEGLTETIQHLESTWKHYLPDRPFSFKFLDEEIDALYRREQGQRRILSTFSALSVLIGGMGVFGLAAFLVDRRLKEISVRKILGASVFSLLRILMRDHLGFIGIATLVATPVAVFVSRNWLEDYTTRIALGPTPFLLSGLICLGAVIAAVSFHAFRALRADPVENLRQE